MIAIHRGLRTLYTAAWLSWQAAVACAGPGDYFKIVVVDESTGRGVPLVELQTTGATRFYTDSHGIAAIGEPGYFGHKIYFHVRSDGYEFEQDGFGTRGVALQVIRGGSATLRIKRLNIAERLYRMTGEGIYRDSVLVGEPAPIEAPLINGQVFGQDGVHAAPYRGRIFWCWGDTNQPAYPLGNFRMSGAISEWPAPRGKGLDPSVGVNLKYFVGATGFSRPMVPEAAIPGLGAIWLSGVVTIPDERGEQRLVAQFTRLEGLGKVREKGFVIYNDQTDCFERLAPLPMESELRLSGHPFRVRDAGVNYLYSGFAMPCVTRVRSDLKCVTDPTAYESFTCLVAGTRYDGAASDLDRHDDGSLNFAWKANTLPLSHQQEQVLIQAGKLRREEGWQQLVDVETGTPVAPHASSIYWNEYRRRWVMIVEQAGGTSPLGEVWYAEADTPIGPWVYATKIVTHEQYSFYNPTQQPFFDQEGGRLIYFEGTYSHNFSGNPVATPRYDYNQVMYRLALDDPRLSLPAPVYRVRNASGSTTLMLREAVDAEHAWNRIEQIAYFAVPGNRPREGTIPLYVSPSERGAKLTPVAGRRDEQPFCRVLPSVDEPREGFDSGRWVCDVLGIEGALNLHLALESDGQNVTGTLAGRTITNAKLVAGRLEFRMQSDGNELSFTGHLNSDRLQGEWRRSDGKSGRWSARQTRPTVPLFEYHDETTKEFTWAPEAPSTAGHWRRSAAPIGRVWKNPSSLLLLDRQAQSVRENWQRGDDE